jgi:hypothetical protein
MILLKEFKLTRGREFNVFISYVLLGGNKVALLKELDEAMVDRSKRESYKQEIMKGLIDFALNIPSQFGKYQNINW